MSAIRRVALCGGTHGNERTGVTAVARRGRFAAAGAPRLYAPRTIELEALIANPAAVAANTRYVDYDLNRCFALRDLDSHEPRTVEHERAREINRILGPKGASQPQFDLTIDLHTTTANLGPTVIIRETDDVAVTIARYVVAAVPGTRILSYRDEPESVWRPRAAGAWSALPPAGGGPGDASLVPGDFPYLAEVTPHGIEIEVGPVPWGVVRAPILFQTEEIIDAILVAIDMINEDALPVVGAHADASQPTPAWRFIADFDYPRTADGELDGFVHPSRQDRDFVALSPGEAMFMTFAGETIAWDGPAGLVPVFINEAAYYEKRAAMTIAERTTV